MSRIGNNSFGYEMKPEKRDIENVWNGFMLKNKICGNVISLTGPAVMEHWNNYRHIIGDENFLVICENNNDRYQFIKSKVDEISNERVVVTFNDILKETLSPPTHRGCHEPKWAVMDYDFCVTVQTLIKMGLLEDLGRIARADVLKEKTGTCLIITACCRPGCNGGRFDAQIYDLFARDIPDIFREEDYWIEIVTPSPHSSFYKDKHGPPMFTMMYYINRDKVEQHYTDSRRNLYVHRATAETIAVKKGGGSMIDAPNLEEIL